MWHLIRAILLKLQKIEPYRLHWWDSMLYKSNSKQKWVISFTASWRKTWTKNMPLSCRFVDNGWTFLWMSCMESLFSLWAEWWMWWRWTKSIGSIGPIKTLEIVKNACIYAINKWNFKLKSVVEFSNYSFVFHLIHVASEYCFRFCGKVTFFPPQSRWKSIAWFHWFKSLSSILST